MIVAMANKKAKFFFMANRCYEMTCAEFNWLLLSIDYLDDWMKLLIN
jgi:hypothetical protein